MKYLFSILVVMFAVMASATPTMADGRNCSGSACDAAHWAATAPAVGGPKARTTMEMACVRVVTYGRTEVLWIEAGHQDYWLHDPFHTQRASAGYVEPFPLADRLVVTESCISMSKLARIDILTLCNGFEIDSGFHWSLTSAELRQLKARGHLTSYVPFLTVEDRERFSVQAVRAAYNRRY